MLETKGNDPAFPDNDVAGMTIREYYACHAMQGYLAKIAGGDAVEPHIVADRAVRLADALIDQLNQD